MSDSTEQDITLILEAASAGDEEAATEVFERVYEELRAIAGRFMASERTDHTLQPTAVVHEAYLRLCGSPGLRWENRAHFFGAAAQAMRQILIDHARRKVSLKRGGDQVRVDLPEFAGKWEENTQDLLAVDEALDSLEARDPQMAAVVKLRFFVGLTIDEIAAALGMSPRAVSRAWAGAKAWLRLQMAAEPQ